ncbi:uncharacterized protein LOC111643665 [Copidosoma floridanum]|uniref:uncharacterized protein LOC111643665 n=1 Tax=Copidosoma floridanum TaxID=29053 RepID=UPI000C6F5653|nr:uncharacterized protein LOC111643665 [Copidosoma floridanum]
MALPCMDNGKCTKKFPQNFLKETLTSDDGYPTYRRRASADGGHSSVLTIRGKEQNLPKLVPDQQQAFDRVIDSVLNISGKVFFLDAPGGTGKTLLINLMLAQARSAGKLGLAVASSGIAANLLSGETAHSAFKLPLCVFSGEDYTCPIRKNGPLARILQDTTFIVWDECTMSHRALIEFVADSQEYLYIDSVIASKDVVDYLQEFLNSLTSSGFPPHKLSLKFGALIMLRRNLQPPNLCNGSRLHIQTPRNNVIEATILIGPFKRLQSPVKVYLR